MDKFQSLKKNTLIFAIANLGSKFIGFILAPLYSYYMTTSEYGVMDVVLTSINLILPILVFNVFEATFRFTISSEDDRKSVLSLSLVIATIGLAVGAFLLPVAGRLFSSTEIVLWVYSIIVLETINLILKQFARGIGRVKEFALNGILASFITLLFNMIFMILFRMGLRGYLLTTVFSYTLTNIYLTIKLKIWKEIKISKLNKDVAIEMLRYSVPLMPLTITWWIMNASDRYIIGALLGTAFNGIYAVANKIPSLLSVLEDVFYQAWQMSAIEQSKEEDKNEFYSIIFNNYIVVMTLAFLSLLIIVKPMVLILFEKSFESAWYIVPILLSATVFHAFSGFLGVFYTVEKKPKGALISTLIGAIVNTLLNIVLIYFIGIMGAAISTVTAYAVVTAYRFIDTKRFVKITLDSKKLMIMLSLCFIQFVVYYLTFKGRIVCQLLVVAIGCLCNLKLITKILNDMYTKYLNKRA